MSSVASGVVTVVSTLIFIHSIYSSYEYRITHASATSLPYEITIPLLLSTAGLLSALLFSGRWKLREVEAGKAYGETLRSGGKGPGFESLEGGWVDIVKERNIVEEWKSAQQKEMSS